MIKYGNVPNNMHEYNTIELNTISIRRLSSFNSKTHRERESNTKDRTNKLQNHFLKYDIYDFPPIAFIQHYFLFLNKNNNCTYK